MRLKAVCTLIVAVSVVAGCSAGEKSSITNSSSVNERQSNTLLRQGFPAADKLCAALTAADVRAVTGSDVATVDPSAPKGLPACKWSGAGNDGYLEMTVQDIPGIYSVSALTEREYSIAGGGTGYLALGGNERLCSVDLIGPKSPENIDLLMWVSTSVDAENAPLKSGRSLCEMATPQVTKVLSTLGWLDGGS